MGLTDALSAVNWFAVIVATAAAFALGGVWYSKSLFGSAWLQEVGLTEQAVSEARMLPVFAGTIILQFVAATALGWFLGNGGTWLGGLLSGLAVGVCWVATSYGITYLYEQRSLRLFWINGGYFMVAFTIMGAIIGVW